MDNEIVTASELGQYTYCKRAWWLDYKKNKIPRSDRLKMGSLKHSRLEKNIDSDLYILIATFVLIGIGLIAIVILGILFL